MTSFQEDCYSFFGQEIEIRSNSPEILNHLKLVYGRFLKGCCEAVPKNRDEWESNSRFRIEVIDQLESKNEILLKDPFDSHRLICKDLYAFDESYYPGRIDIDPLAYIQWIVLRDVSLNAKDYFLIHAGALSWAKEGLILCAPSGFGKTTLTVKLVMRGFKFLSDEVASLNMNSGKIEPFFRKINLNEESRKLLGLPPWTHIHTRLIKRKGLEWMLDMEDVVKDSLSHAVIPRCLLFLRGFGEKPRLESVAKSNGLFELLKSWISPGSDPASLLFRMTPLMNKIQCFNLVVGDLNETADRVLKLAREEKWQNG